MASVSWYSLSIALFLFFLAFLFTKHIHGELYSGFLWSFTPILQQTHVQCPGDKSAIKHKCAKVSIKLHENVNDCCSIHRFVATDVNHCLCFWKKIIVF